MCSLILRLSARILEHGSLGTSLVSVWSHTRCIPEYWEEVTWGYNEYLFVQHSMPLETLKLKPRK